MSVVFRLTIYEANGSTVDFTLTSIRSGTNPYITGVPSGDGQEVDLLTGSVRSGAYVVEVADVATGTDATGTIRIVTSNLEDNKFRQQLLSRRAKLECSRNNGSTWDIWTFGYLTNLRQTDAITYAFTVSDSRRIEATHTAFTWSANPNAATDEQREFPNRGCLAGGPTIESFGPIRASGGWEYAWQEVQGRLAALNFIAAYNPPSWARNSTIEVIPYFNALRPFLQTLPPIANVTGANFAQLRDRQYVYGSASVQAIITAGASKWTGTVRGAHTPPSPAQNGQGAATVPRFGDMNFMYIDLDPGQSTSYPSQNTIVRVQLIQKKVSEISPLYIAEHPVDIVTKLYDTVNIPYDSASATAVKALIGDDLRLALRITAPVVLGKFLADSIFGPFGFSARTNASGEQEFFTTRIARSATPTISITDADIVGDTPPPIFELEEASVVTSFRLTTKALTPFLADPTQGAQAPPDGIIETEISEIVENGDVSTFSTREVAYSFPGMLYSNSTSTTAFTLSPEVVGSFFTGILAEGFDRFGRGAVASEVQVLASSNAAALQVGDEVLISASYYPNKNYRIGESNVGSRIAQIVRRTEAPEGPIFKLIDSGVNAQPTAPTFTVAADAGDPRRVAAVTVTNAATLNASEITLAVQYQVSANTPTKTGTLYTRFRPGTIPTVAFTLPPVLPGSKVWVRMRTERTEYRASAWTAWTSVTLDAWVAPASLTVGTTTANSVALSWSLGSPTANTIDPIDVFAYQGASAPADWTPYRIGSLSNGSTSTTIRNLDASTQYTFGVAFKDEASGGYSTFATATTTTAATNTVSAPAAPKMKVYTSFPNAGQSTGVALAIGAIEGYNIVVQRAPDSSGSPGTWADIALLAPLTPIFVDPLPSDGVTRWYRVFYRLSGFLDGSAGPARSAIPIAIPDDLIGQNSSIISGGASLTFGSYLVGTPDNFYDGATSQSLAVDATSASTANKVVARDNTGSFSANTVTATLNGPAPAGQLTGDTLAANVVTSSLTSVGTIGTGTWQGTSVGKNYGGTGLTSTAFTGITNERVFAYDGGSGSFFIAPSGSNGQALVYSGGALAWGNPAPGSHVLADTTGLGSQHTTSGLTTGMILQATGATTARFQTPSIPASSVTAGTFSGTSYTITNDLTVSGTLTASLPWSSITGTPTTLSGYGITDALSNSTSSTQSGYFGDIYLWDDTNPSHYLQITNSADLSAARTLSINVNDASRTVSLSGNLTVSGNATISGTSSGTNTGDQTITLTGDVTGSGTGSFATTYAGTVPIAKGGTNKTSYSTTGTGTRVAVYDQGTGAFDVVSAGSSGQFLQSSGTTGDVQFATPPNFTSSAAGYAPASGGGTTNFLRADGTWAVPAVGSVSANNVTAGTFSGATYTFSNSVTFTSGVRVAFGETYKILNSGGTAVDVLSATTLGSGVINSSLTSVGTLTSGALGAGFTAIDNARLANSSITINGSAVSLGGSITIPVTQWVTNGSNIYYSTGSVGIGTSTPVSNLHISGSGSTWATFANTTGTNQYVDVGSNNAGQHFVYGYGNYPLLIGTNGATRIYVTGSGNVGIGTTSPGGKLEVNNGSYFTIYGTSTGDFAAPALAPHAVTGDFTVYAGAVGSGAERFKITQAGKVSVGSSVPMTQQFQVQGAIVGGTINGTGTPNITGITNQLAFEVRSSQAGAEPAIAYHKENVYTFYLQGQNSIRGLRLYGPTDETAPSLFVAESIVAGATTAPNKLYINNTAAADVALFESSQTYSTLAFKSSTNTDTVTVGIDGSGNAAFENKKAGASMSFVLKDTGTASRTRLHILENGNIGIGTTSPAYRLVVAGTIHSSTGGFRFPDGTTQTTAATPSQWTTSGSDIYYSAGNVGIGTTAVLNALTVQGNLSFPANTHLAGNIRLWQESNNADAFVSHAIGTEAYHNRYGAGSSYTSSIGHKFYRGGGELIAQIGFGGASTPSNRLDSYFAGYVGIGTSTPIRALHIAGTAAGSEFILENTAMPANNRKFNLWADPTAGTSGRFYIRTLNDAGNATTTSFLTFDNASGNVGINTTSPSYKLHVLNNTDGFISRFTGGTSSNVNIGLYGNTASGFASIGTESNHDFNIYTNGVDAVYIKTSGRVGIGTNAPTATLHVGNGTDVGGSAVGSGAIVLYGAGGVIPNTARPNIYHRSNVGLGLSSDFQMSFQVNTGVSTVDAMRIGSTGNFGIGDTVLPATTPWKGTALIGGSGRDKVIVGSLVSTYEGATIGGHNSAATAWSTLNISGGAIVFRASETEHSRFDTSGNLGMGTSSPQSRLDVRGIGLFGEFGSSGAYNPYATIHVRRVTGPAVVVEAIGYNTSAIAANGSTYGLVFAVENGGMEWRTGCTYNGNFTSTGTSRMVMTSAGKVEINGGGWNSSRLIVTESSGSTAEINGTSNTANQSPLYVWNNVESGSTYFISFYSDGQNNARTLRGYINYRRDIATMNLTTASDYRIKTVYGEYTKSGAIFDKIKVHEATINGESGRHPMVLAHELDEAYPVAVEGEKDAVNEDGTPKLQMVSYNAMIPLMLAEIKSLRARVAALES